MQNFDEWQLKSGLDDHFRSEIANFRLLIIVPGTVLV